MISNYPHWYHPCNIIITKTPDSSAALLWTIFPQNSQLILPDVNQIISLLCLKPFSGFLLLTQPLSLLHSGKQSIWQLRIKSKILALVHSASRFSLSSHLISYTLPSGALCSCVLVGLGCQHKILKTGWLKEQKFISSQFWRLDNPRSKSSKVWLLVSALLLACRGPPSVSSHGREREKDLFSPS